jgi:CoA:oxalate CoA-transferase
VVIAASSDILWEKLCHVMECPAMLKDPKLADIGLRCENYYPIVEPVMRQWVEARTSEEVDRILGEAGIPVAPVLEIDQVVNHPNTQAREMLVEVDHPTLGKIRIPGIPIKMFGTPGQIRRPAPLLGEHNREILENLGVDKCENALREAGML